MASQSRTVAARAGYFASAGDRLGGRVASGRRLVAGREGPVLEVPLRLRVFGDERGELGEGGFDVGVGHRVGVDAAADAPRQGRAEDAVAVDRDIAGRALVRVGRDALDRARQAECQVEVEDALRVVVREVALDVGDHGVHDAVDRDGLAVAELEALVRLERPRERVPKVHGPQERLLPEVGADALEHRVDGPLDDLVGDGVVDEVPLDEALSMILHEVEERRVVDERGLHDLAARGHDVRFRERREERGVDERVAGRVEVAHAVLAVVVHRDLDADGRVDHPEERRGQPRPRHAASPQRAREARRVRQDAAADGERGLRAPERVDATELVEDKEHVVHGLLVLVARRDDGVEDEVHGRGPGSEDVLVQAPDRRVDDAHQTARR
mmetsp:Transcript_27143/g.84387  ORF Transcript_27143/g.84387 Transcript_27143/m.84387 type:complete len:384 (-) Transcript_27143:2221-3372(-)